jgi:hypothetical protein
MFFLDLYLEVFWCQTVNRADHSALFVSNCCFAVRGLLNSYNLRVQLFR